MKLLKKIAFGLLVSLLCALFSACASIAPRKVAEVKGMVVVPKGWFLMGRNSAEMNERPEHQVYLDTYLIDKYEVSAKQFAQFLNAKGNPDNRYFSEDRYSTIMGVSLVDGKEVPAPENPQKYVPRKGLEDYPANNVSWYGADAYCRWKGKYLPSEAQWEKAARCDDGRLYPWGDSMPDENKARYDEHWKKLGAHVMVPVDALPAGASCYGALNMAGNVSEWVADWYRQNYCDFCSQTIENNIDVSARLLGLPKPDISPEKEEQADLPPRRNPEGPLMGSFKVMRGGSWYDSYGQFVMMAPYRYWFHPADRYLNFGFRCAKDAFGKKKKKTDGQGQTK